MIHRVFAYGSNMHLGDLRRWMNERDFADASILGAHRAALDGWELVWNYRSPARNGGAANVRPRPGGVLPGVVLDLDARGLTALDRKEGHPDRYCRGESMVEVRLVRPEGEARAEAWLYVVTEPFRHAHTIAPRRAYRELLVRGAREHGLPAAHIDALMKVPTAD